MKTSGLKKIVEENCCTLHNSGEWIVIYKKDTKLGFVSKINCATFITYDNMPKVIAQAILDYAYTPLEEREEKKYQLRLNISRDDIDDIYLNLNFDTYRYFMYNNEQSNWRKNVFTQKEIDDMPFDTKFFEKVEVE